MGGMRGQVEGRTKLGTWIEFKKEMSKAGLLTKRGQASQGMYAQWPIGKRDAFEIMEEKPDGTGWVLRYHFHS